MLVDSHCHLDFDSFDEDRPETLNRAFDAGVGMMVTICTRLSRFEAIKEIAEMDDRLYCSVGIHPHQVAEEETATFEALVSRAAHPKVVGIGETGLDYYYDSSPRDDQATSFRTHIAAARETGLPLIVHTRDADEDMVAILRDEAGKGAFPCVLHCFSSSRPLAEAALELGFYISCSGIVTFKNAEDLRGIIRDVPLDRLIVETDSPFLAPIPNRGKRNEPSFVVHTAEKIAELKGLNMAEFSRISTENFFRLFAKAVPPASGTP
ncbi:MAG: TatD family hydrolase [Rhodospirillaceae bacterium]|jgi:TatD DNase family protein|nr:TatD family hydrolase [Rhodospirillaceae bacterium]MBT5455364.1 TatD family hydrolase [Rhodospirillaceae bacterium]